MKILMFFILFLAGSSGCSVKEKKASNTEANNKEKAKKIINSIKKEGIPWKFEKKLNTKGKWIKISNENSDYHINETLVEEKMWRFVKTQYSDNFEDRKLYSYQYKLISENIIHINALCWFVSNSDPTKIFITINDGGTCFFNLKYNFEKDIFFDLYVNGES